MYNPFTEHQLLNTIFSLMESIEIWFQPKLTFSPSSRSAKASICGVKEQPFIVTLSVPLVIRHWHVHKYLYPKNTLKTCGMIAELPPTPLSNGNISIQTSRATVTLSLGCIWNTDNLELSQTRFYSNFKWLVRCQNDAKDWHKPIVTLSAPTHSIYQWYTVYPPRNVSSKISRLNPAAITPTWVRRGSRTGSRLGQIKSSLNPI